METQPPEAPLIDPSTPVLIVGAGLAGLSAAEHLRRLDGGNHRPITIVDKGRSVGGRLATRRIGRATLDHGAQFFTVRSDHLGQTVAGWRAAGIVEEWCQGFGEVDGYPRYRANGGMNTLAKHLRQSLEADGVTIVTGQRVAALIADGEGWTATYDGATREPDEAGAVVATPPVPQTLELLAAGAVPVPVQHRLQLEGFTYHRVLALLTVLDRPSGLPGPGALQQPADPTFSFVADNQAKGISPEPAVTFHTAHTLSAELWDLDDAEIAARLLEPARALVAPATITSHQVKRWRYSGPVTPHPLPCLVLTERPGPLILAGDGFGTSRFEGAFLSGVAAAEALAGTGTP